MAKARFFASLKMTINKNGVVQSGHPVCFIPLTVGTNYP